MEEKICGIYCIENQINGKRYIGQSVDIYTRWKKHRKFLNAQNDKQENPHFIHAWHKYGEENFLFYIIEQCAQDLLNDKEQYWINYYNTTNAAMGYNKTIGGTGGNTIINYTEDQLIKTKEKRSRHIKESLPKGENSYMSKLTNQQVLEIVNCFQNGDYDANIASKFHVSSGIINDIRTRKTWTSITDKFNWGKSLGKQIGKKRSVSIDMYTEDGLFVKTFTNARIAEKETGTSYKLISSVCHGHKRIANGYIWRLHNHPFDEFRTTIKSTHINSIVSD